MEKDSTRPDFFKPKEFPIDPAPLATAYLWGAWDGSPTMPPGALFKDVDREPDMYLTEPQLQHDSSGILYDDEKFHPLKFHYCYDFLAEFIDELSGVEMSPLFCEFFRFFRWVDPSNALERIDIFSAGKSLEFRHYRLQEVDEFGRAWGLEAFASASRGIHAFGVIDARTGEAVTRHRARSVEQWHKLNMIEYSILSGLTTYSDAKLKLKDL